MSNIEDVRNKIRSIDVEISKHRKLLNRAVGNNLVCSINFHYENIIELITEKKKYNNKLNDLFKPIGLYGK